MSVSAYKEYTVWKEEKIDGKTYLMSPTAHYNHGRLIGRIFAAFDRYLKGKPCEAFTDTLNIILDEDNTVIPDVSVICDKSKFTQRGYEGAPALVVEILSPSSVKRDRYMKLKLYERSGIKEFWLADYMNRTIEIFVLENNEYICKNTVIFPDEYERERVPEEQKAEYTTKFRSYEFPDAEFDMEELFEGVK